MILDELVASPDPIIANAAKRLADLNTKLANRAISLGEYEELAGDVTDLTAITNDIADLDRRLKLQAAFDAMILIVQAAMALKP